MDVDLPLARRDVIAGRLSKGQAVVAGVLADEFRVSEDAIRRDLRALAAEGRCRRVYGGALPLSASTEPMASRMLRAPERKTQLARAAVDSIAVGELLFLDSGSTNLALVDVLPQDADLTIATNAVEIASAVLRRQDLRLIVVGGTADPVIGGCVDAAAVQTVMQMRFDRVFLGACAVSPDHGVGVFHFSDATFKRAVLAASDQVMVMATREKLAERAPHRVTDLREVDLLVVEHGISDQQRTRLQQSGCRLMVADAN